MPGNNGIHSSFISFCLIILSSGCSVPTPARSPTPQPSLTSIVTLGATATPQPSDTPAPTKVKTPTPEPEAPTSTPVIVETIIASQKPRISASLLSPDGEWRAEVAIYHCVPFGNMGEYGLEQLRLVQVSNGAEKIADRQVLACGGLGAFGFSGLFWSSDSRLFYYTNAREGFPEGCGYWERPILRVDVTNRVVENLGGGPVSPDGSKLATWQERELVVWDINDGEIGRAPANVPGVMLGPITWSPDSQALVYVQIASYCPLSGKSYIVRLDLPKLLPNILLESESPSFASVEWEVSNVLRLFDENGKEWRYHFLTKELEPVP